MRTATCWSLPVLLAAYVVAGVSCAPPAAIRCDDLSDCQAGFLCIEGMCLRDPNADAGSARRDAGPPPDASGPPADAASPDDAGSSDDAGSPGDAGVLVDASAPEDGGLDAGETPDAGSPQDAGSGADGGPLDAGPPPLMVLAVHPAQTAVGEMVSLEGWFPAGSYDVVFEGASPLALVVPAGGVARMNVVVPNDATSGIVVRQTPDGDEVQVDVIVLPFAPTPGVFSEHHEQTAWAQRQESTDDDHRNGTAFVRDGRLWILGDDYSPVADRARLNADGSYGDFVDTSLGSGINRAAYARVGDRAYALGGEHAGGAEHALVRGAHLDSPGQWTVLPEALNEPRRDAQALVIGRYLYVIGGSGDNYQELATIERAPLRADGSLAGGFELYSETLVNARRYFTATLARGRLFVVGGRTQNEQVSGLVEVCDIDAQGNLGPFASADYGEFPHDGAPLVDRAFHAAALVGERLCVFGGIGTNDQVLDSVQCAPVDGAGELGDFVVEPYALPRPTVGAQAILAGDRLLVLGGEADSDGLVDAPPAQALLAGGLPSGFTEGPALVAPGSGRRGVACAVHGDYLYVIGGYNAGTTASLESETLSDEILRAPIGLDGTLGEFASAGPALARPRMYARVAVDEADLYVIGGIAADGVDDSYERFGVGDDDTLTAGGGGALLATARAAPMIFWRDDVLHIVGGTASGGFTGQLETFGKPLEAPVSPTSESAFAAGIGNGGQLVVGEWAGFLGGELAGANFSDGVRFSTGGAYTFLNGELSEPRARGAALHLGDELWLGGGVDSMGSRDDWDRVALEADGPAAAAWALSSASPLPAEATRDGCVVRVRGRVHLIGGWNGAAATHKTFTTVLQ